MLREGGREIHLFVFVDIPCLLYVMHVGGPQGLFLFSIFSDFLFFILYFHEFLFFTPIFRKSSHIGITHVEGTYFVRFLIQEALHIILCSMDIISIWKPPFTEQEYLENPYSKAI